MKKRTEFQKKRSGVNNDAYRDILLKRQAEGKASESELNWIEQNFREPRIKLPKANNKLDFFRKTIRHVVRVLDKDK